MTPWFYAIGGQELVGDYAFPERFQQDPFYTFGRKFVVTERDDSPVIKTCLGCRVLQKRDDSPRGNRTPELYRVIFWDDGTIWNEGWCPYFRSARPLEESEVWIEEAMAQFQKLLAGRTTTFEINFLGGSRFVGRFIPSTEDKKLKVAGRYFAVVHLKGKSEPKEGWFDFEPTAENHDVHTFLKVKFEGNGQIIERVKISKKATDDGRKWSGVFLNLEAGSQAAA